MQKAGDFGLQVIITLTHLPGRMFDRMPDTRLWAEVAYQDELKELWSAIVSSLSGCTNIAGYDLVNEPYMLEEVGRSQVDDSQPTWIEPLSQLYSELVSTVRLSDRDTMVILESSNWASPLALPMLSPVKTPA